MSRARRLARALLVFGGASIGLLGIAAQFTPEWRAASDEPLLDPTPAVPGETPAPARPITTSEITVDHDDGRAARAWIVAPEAIGSASHDTVPGIVLVHGSGSADRETLRREAEAFAGAGIAAITYDKRADGFGPFERDYGRLAADTVGAATALASSPGVDASRIGILGISEGGWVAPMAAARDPDRFAFLVLASAPIVSPLHQVAWAVDERLSGAPDWLRRIPAAALSMGRHFSDSLDTDITPALGELRVPVFAAWGADDTTMPVNVAVRTLLDHTEVPVAARVFADTGHSLGTGAWLRDVTAWIQRLPDTGLDVGLTGAEPGSRLGLATLPTSGWLLHPVGHAEVAGTLAVGAALLPGRRRETERSTAHGLH